MNSQAVATLVVWAIGIGVGIVALVIFKDFIRWLLGIPDIIRLVEEQNKLLETIAANATKLPSPVVKAEAPEASPMPRPNPLTG